MAAVYTLIKDEYVLVFAPYNEELFSITILLYKQEMHNFSEHVYTCTHYLGV